LLRSEKWNTILSAVSGSSSPGKGEIENFVALATSQLRVADCPEMIEDWVAVKELIVGAAGLVGMR